MLRVSWSEGKRSLCRVIHTTPININDAGQYNPEIHSAQTFNHVLREGRRILPASVALLAAQPLLESSPKADSSIFPFHILNRRM